MPTYVYKCKACQKEFETVQKFSDEPLVKCPSCKKNKLVRVISGSGLVFKGSGFYLTDYKKRSTSENAPATTTTSESEGKGKSATPPTKEPESKADTETSKKPSEKHAGKKKK